MTAEKLMDEIMTNMVNKPHNWRIGQFVFNYIDTVYHVARTVQFKDNVDCFYDDKNINNFVKHAARYIE